MTCIAYIVLVMHGDTSFQGIRKRVQWIEESHLIRLISSEDRNEPAGCFEVLVVSQP